MRKKTWIGLVVAAVVVIIGGALIGFTEERRVEVKIDQENTVDINVDGEVTVINLEDLADGESREIQAGDELIVVTRNGDSLNVNVDGDEDFVWHGDEGSQQIHKKVIVVDSGEMEFGDGEKMVMVHAGGDLERVDSDEIKVVIKALENGLGEDAIDFKVLTEDVHGGDSPMVIKTHHVTNDMVRFRCPEDQTEITLKKELATQDNYLCPVCGRAMEKAPQEKMMHFVTEIKTDPEE